MALVANLHDIPQIMAEHIADRLGFSDVRPRLSARRHRLERRRGARHAALRLAPAASSQRPVGARRRRGAAATAHHPLLHHAGHHLRLGCR